MVNSKQNVFVNRTVLVTFFAQVFLWLFSSSLLAAPADSLLARQPYQLYHAKTINVIDELRLPANNVNDIVSLLTPVESFERIQKGSYWLRTSINNAAVPEQWTFRVLNSSVDYLAVFTFHEALGQSVSSAYAIIENGVVKHQYEVGFDVPANQVTDVLIFIQGQRFSGDPLFRFYANNAESGSHQLSTTIVIACLGALTILSIYNLLLGLWSRDKSLLYYFLYIFLTVASSMIYFDVYPLLHYPLVQSFSLPSLYLLVFCGSLYSIYFLELDVYYPAYAKLFYGLAISTVLLLVLSYSVSHLSSIYFLFFLIASWICLSLIAGVSRWLQGYLPARFFNVSFFILLLSLLISLLPYLNGVFKGSESEFLRLICQTFSGLIMALAVADRVNILRDEKEMALQKTLALETWAIERQKETRNKLEQTLLISKEDSQRKSDFLRLVSHELRTPLYSIISSVEQWRDVAGEDNRRDLLSFMSYGAARLRMQVDNLVLLAETDDIDVEPNVREFELRTVLSRLEDKVRGLLVENVGFDINCSSHVPKFLIGDDYLFEHMLRTVLENACKHTEQGRVVLTLDWDDGLEIKLTDTGCGMTREQEKSMFKDFVQVSRGLERRSEGLGIGLTVCYRLSEILGADLDIRSILGLGTEVHIRVPFQEAGSLLKAVDMDNTISANVLIVEDNPVNSHVLESLVESLSCCSTIVNSGDEALTILSEQQFDLVLMDIQMPVMDGITATRWIRQSGNQVPVVAVTSNSDADVRKRCQKVGMCDFLVKPVTRKDIKYVLQRYVKHTSE